MLLLQSAYSTVGKIESSLFKILVVEYGVALPCLSLRHAILAFAASDLPPEQFGDKVEFHTQQARRIFIRKLETGGVIEAADIFAAFILAFLFLDRDQNESAVHANGCNSMIMHLSASAKTRPISHLFAVFEPFICDRINVLRTRYHSSIPARRTTFSEMVRYIGELRRTGARFDIYESDSMNAIHDYLNCLLRISFNSFRYIAIYEFHRNYDRKSFVERLVEYIKLNIEDQDFRRAVDLMTNSDERFIPYDFAQLQTVDYLLVVLEATSIFEGFWSPKATEAATNLLSRLRSQAPLPRCLYEGDPRNYGLLVAISGIGLLTTEDSERKTKSVNR